MDGIQFLARATVFFVLIYFVLWPLYAAFRFTYPSRLRVAYFTPTSLGVVYEDVVLRASDNTELVGWYIPSRNGAAIILLHGLRSNRLMMVRHAESLIKAGYGVLLFDLRAHGDSGGRNFARSQREVDDVLTAVAYLTKRSDVNAAGIGVLGVSIGGLLALQAAAQTVAIRGCVADGASPAIYADLPPPGSLLDWAQRPMQRLFMSASHKLAGEPYLPATTAVLAGIAPRPVMFVAAGKGGEKRLGDHYLAASAEPRSLWVVAEARHAETWHERPNEYAHRLVDFFDKALVLQDKRRILLPEPSVAVEPAFSSPAPPVTGPIDVTISMVRANLIAFAIFPLVYFLLLVPYRWLWQDSLVPHLFGLSVRDFVLIVVLLMSCVGIHEWLHAFGFRRAGKVPRDSIRFGFSWRGLAPYAHCEAPMRANAYRTAIVLPGLLLGILPALLGLLFGLWWLVGWGALMLITAGGDLAVMFAIRGVPGDMIVRDHPTRVGCILLPEATGEEDED